MTYLVVTLLFHSTLILFCYGEAKDKIKDICLFEILKAFLRGNYCNVTMLF